MLCYMKSDINKYKLYRRMFLTNIQKLPLQLDKEQFTSGREISIYLSEPDSPGKFIFEK